MVKTLKAVIFMMAVCILLVINIYADNPTNTWYGYSAYNLNNAAIRTDTETRTYTINGNRASAVTVYSLINSSSSDLTVIMGIPVNELDSISVKDNNKSLKLKTRSLSGIRSSYNIETQLPQATAWYSCSVYMKAGETHTVQVTTDEYLLKGSNDIYNLSFLRDKNNPGALNGVNIQLKAGFTDYKPYDIADIDGLQYNDISKDGKISLALKSDAVNGFDVKYQPVDKMLLDKLSASVYKKPKAIVRAFKALDYKTAITLCDEYIAFPQDKKLNTDQVKLVKAESLRKQEKYDEYIDALAGIDTSTLYPANIKYKLLYDKLNIYKAEDKESEYTQLLKQLDSDTATNYKFLNNWLKSNGYVLKEAETAKPAAPDIASKPASATEKKASRMAAFLESILKFIKSIRYDVAIGVVVGLIIGYLLGRRSGSGGSRRRRGTVYLFRN